MVLATDDLVRNLSFTILLECNYVLLDQNLQFTLYLILKQLEQFKLLVLHDQVDQYHVYLVIVINDQLISTRLAQLVVNLIIRELSFQSKHSRQR